TSENAALGSLPRMPDPSIERHLPAPPPGHSRRRDRASTPMGRRHGSRTVYTLLVPRTQPAPAASAAAAAPTAPAPAHAKSAVASEKRRWGSEGTAVEQLQSTLNEHGASLSVDGKFGKLTHGAVKDFQRSQDLQVDGIVGPKTQSALSGSDAPASTGGTSA